MTQMTSCLHSEKVIPLPVTVDSHAIAYEWNDALWLLINRFSEQQTYVYKINDNHEVLLVSKLSIMSSTVVSCNDQLIVTGSNSTGKPLIIGINSEGEQLWNHLLLEIDPITWPVTSCGNDLLLVWQESIDTLETGSLNIKTNIFQRHSKIKVETPPVALFSWKNHLHGIWLDPRQIHDMDITNNKENLMDRNGEYADNFTIGIANNNIYYGWATKDKVSFQFSGEQEISSVDIQNASDGEITTVSGEEPLIWIQHSELDIDDELIWNSVLVLPGKETYKLKEYVFAVAWWQGGIVVVHPSRIEILRKK